MLLPILRTAPALESMACHARVFIIRRIMRGPIEAAAPHGRNDFFIYGSSADHAIREGCLTAAAAATPFELMIGLQNVDPPRSAGIVSPDEDR